MPETFTRAEKDSERTNNSNCFWYKALITSKVGFFYCNVFQVEASQKKKKEK